MTEYQVIGAIMVGVPVLGMAAFAIKEAGVLEFLKLVGMFLFIWGVIAIIVIGFLFLLGWLP